MAALTLANLVSLVRRRIRDQNKNSFPDDADLRDELNHAAAGIVRRLQRHQVIAYDRTTEDITSVAGTADYTLTSSTARRLWKLEEVDGDAKRSCREIPEDVDNWRNYALQDREGRWHYVLSRAAATGKYTVHFPGGGPGSGLTFRAHLLRVNTALATNGDDDALSYTQIPEDWHELVGQEVVVELLDPGASLYPGALNKLSRLNDELINDAALGVDPGEILDVSADYGPQ